MFVGLCCRRRTRRAQMEGKKERSGRKSGTGQVIHSTHVIVHHITVTIATTVEGKQPVSNGCITPQHLRGAGLKRFCVFTRQVSRLPLINDVIADRKSPGVC